MNVALRRGMTTEAFLAWDETQPDRWEFDGFEPVAMTGGTREHSLVCVNLAAALTSRLRGTRCTAYDSSLRIAVAGRIRYPDMTIARDPLPRGATMIAEPLIVFEVDGTAKVAEYRATPSIQRCVLLSEDRIGALVHARRGGEWVTTALAEPGDVLDLPEAGISLPLSELYEDVFPPP